MRAGFGIGLLVLAALTLILCGNASGSSSYSGPRNKPRTIRGFKNVALSTARGFGKRGISMFDLLTSEDQSNQIARNVDSIPVEWFIEELSRNPDLAATIVRKFLDQNQDGLLTTEELLRPIN